LRVFISLTLFFLFPGVVSAYGVETHAALTQEAAYFYNHHYPKTALDNVAIDQLMFGARHEDDFPRMLNHFYDPINDKGLTFAGKTWNASKVWIQNKSLQNIALYRTFSSLGSLFDSSIERTSGYTWERAVDDYAHGKERDGLVGLGHVLHLIEDLTVPAHVRNDAHPPTGKDDKVWGGEDPYEEWTHKFTPENIRVFEKIKQTKPVLLSRINEYFDQLATYTNTHFYSKDTIGFDWYAKPNPVGKSEIVIDSLSYQQFNDVEGSYLLSQGRTFSKSAINNLDAEKIVVNDDRVLNAYWNRLGTKAVQYAAGVIRLFFDEVAVRKQQLASGSAGFTGSAIELLGTKQPATESVQGEAPNVSNTTEVPLPAAPVANTATGIVSVPTTQVQVTSPEPESTRKLNIKRRGSSSGSSSRADVKDDTSSEDEDSEPQEAPVTEEVPTSTEVIVVAPEPVRTDEAAHIVISEVFMDMDGADTAEFVELYNPTGTDIDISGYSLQYLSGSATSTEKITKKNFTEGARIKSKSFYLIGLGSYSTTTVADMTWSQSLNNESATLALVDRYEALTDVSSPHIIDSVSYGTGEGVSLFTNEPAERVETGSSLERKAYSSGCQVATGEAEFLGNACDTDTSSSDFVVRSQPRPQSTTNFKEPRELPTKPTREAHLDSIVRYDKSVARLYFTWLPSVDFRGATSSIRYVITEKASGTTLFSDTSRFAYDYPVNYLNKTYRFAIQAFDAEGLESESVELEQFIPSYTTGMEFFRDPLSFGTSSIPRYIVRIHWDEYPFIPVHKIYNGAGERGNAWKVAVFYYNSEPAPIQYLGETFESHFWGMRTMPNGLVISYPNCGSNALGSALILPDTQAECPANGFKGLVRGQAMDKNYFGNGELDLVPPDHYFGSDPPVPGEDFVTVSFYAFVNGGIAANQELISIDTKKYYFSEVVP